MIDRYTRAAHTLADLRYEPFPDVTLAMPELVDFVPRLVPRLAQNDDPAETELTDSSGVPPAYIWSASGFVWRSEARRARFEAFENPIAPTGGGVDPPTGRGEWIRTTDP